MNRKLYLFDFDGTLTKKDSLFDFLKFSFPSTYKKQYLLFIPLFIIAKLKIIDAGKVKEMFISVFTKGKSYQELRFLGQEYFKHSHKNIIHPKAHDFINSINNYHDKFIVSASVDFWLEPFADYYGMGLICTKANFNEEGIYTGYFATPNCNYIEKKKRIKQEIDLSLYDEVLAFGDTNGDKKMFSLASKSYFRYFN